MFCKIVGFSRPNVRCHFLWPLSCCYRRLGHHSILPNIFPSLASAKAKAPRAKQALLCLCTKSLFARRRNLGLVTSWKGWSWERERCQTCLISRKIYNYTNNLIFMLAVYIEERNIVKPNETLPKWNEDFGLFLLSLVRMARTWLHLWSTSIRWSRSSRLRRKRKVQILVQRLAGSRRTFVGCWMTGNDLLGMIWDDLVWLGQDLATWSLVDEQFSSWFLLQRDFRLKLKDLQAAINQVKRFDEAVDESLVFLAN